MIKLILFSMFALLPQGKTLATTYIIPAWEQMATTSEFIGIVECVTAGGIVARYRVVDSWKGSAIGSELNIGQHVDFFEPQFPIALCGERFLVFGEMAVSLGISSFTSGGAMPLWWRKIPTDLRCFSTIPIRGSLTRNLSSYFGDRTVQFEDFKTTVTGFLKSGKSEQELRLMLAVARAHLQLPDPKEPSSKGDEADIEFYDTLQSAKTVEELWRLINGRASSLIVPQIPESADDRQVQRHKFTLFCMLKNGGREQCQELLEKADLSKLPWEQKEVDQARSSIRRALFPDVGRSVGPGDADAKDKKPPRLEDIATAEDLMAKHWDYQTGLAFESLCRHKPGSLVPFLVDWEPSKNKRDEHFGYLLGSAFGHLCVVDRAQHLRSLQSARNSWIRASAAVYLRFDDHREGEDALRKAAMIDGDPGSWAALVLASRGDKAAMMRALGVMSAPHEGMLTGNRGNLQKRLLVLLSNAASASGVPQPPAPQKEYPDGSERAAIQKQWHDALIRWWNENQERIVLADPWTKYLDEQKVD